MIRILFLVAAMLATANGYAQLINTFAGGGSTLGDGGPATAARVDNPGGIYFDRLGAMYIASGTGCRIRKIDATGVITTVAGTGTAGYSGDGGAATAARLKYPTCIEIDTVGNLYISDGQNFTIRKIDAVTGIITTVCGNGTQGYTGDGGPASAAKLFGPDYISFDRHGNLYIAEPSAHVIRKIDVAGIITTIAGTGTAGYNGDGIPATDAQLYHPLCIVPDTAGNLYLTDGSNARIRKIGTDGIITTIAGNGTGSFSGEGGSAALATFTPTRLRFGNGGDLYFSTGNYRVAKIGTDGVMTVVAGNGVMANTGDGGPATAASMHHPIDLIFDSCDNMYISVNNHNRVRKVTFNPYATPTVSLAAVASAAAGTTVTVTATIAAGTGAYTIQWYRNSVPVATTTTPIYTYTKPPGTDTITATIAPAVGYCSAPATATAILVAELPVGIDNPTGPAPLLLYPNPTHAVLHLQAATPILQATLHTITGSMVHTSTPGTHTTTIDIAALPPGIYLLRINGLHTYKVVKQ